jgi:CDP-diacylglycerol--serine O-phosphatidyltransferase
MKFRSFKELKFNARTVAFVLFIVTSSAIISLQTNPAFVLTWLLACYIVLALVELVVGIPGRVSGARRERRTRSAAPSIPPSK